MFKRELCVWYRFVGLLLILYNSDGFYFFPNIKLPQLFNIIYICPVTKLTVYHVEKRLKLHQEIDALWLNFGLCSNVTLLIVS